jgi:hypothetical protein
MQGSTVFYFAMSIFHVCVIRIEKLALHGKKCLLPDLWFSEMID